MAETITLEAQPRTTVGKKVRHLRAQDMIPAVVYGPKMESVQIQVPRGQLKQSLRQAGGTSVIALNVGGESYNVLVRDVQRDILKGDVLHVDFYAVAMDTRITTEVPITLIGESQAVHSGEAILITRANVIEVECLPGNIPHELVLDLSNLVEVGDFLTVADLQVPENVEVLADPEEVLVRTEYATKATEEEEAEEAEEVAAEAESVEVIKRGKAEEEEAE